MDIIQALLVQLREQNQQREEERREQQQQREEERREQQQQREEERKEQQRREERQQQQREEERKEQQQQREEDRKEQLRRDERKEQQLREEAEKKEQCWKEELQRMRAEVASLGGSRIKTDHQVEFVPQTQRLSTEKWERVPLSSIPVFDGNPRNFHLWLSKLNSMWRVFEIEEETDKKRVLEMSCTGSALDWYDDLCEQNPHWTFQEIITELRSRALPTISCTEAFRKLALLRPYKSWANYWQQFDEMATILAKKRHFST